VTGKIGGARTGGCGRSWRPEWWRALRWANRSQLKICEQNELDDLLRHVLESMAIQAQFGHTLFLDGFEAGSAAEKLNRLHFSKSASETAPYDEAWLQRLIMRHPSLLPVDQIEPAFNTLVPICIELPMRSGSLDNLLVTPAGDFALVECKLWRHCGVVETPGCDYRYRILVPRRLWEGIVVELTREQTWHSFKNEVARCGGHDDYEQALHEIWEVMHNVQTNEGRSSYGRDGRFAARR